MRFADGKKIFKCCMKFVDSAGKIAGGKRESKRGLDTACKTEKIRENKRVLL
jgi:hypothetical protein